MKKSFLFLSLIAIFLFVSCAKPPQVVSFSPSTQNKNVFKIVEGKKTNKNLGLTTALILPKGSIPSFEQTSSTTNPFTNPLTLMQNILRAYKISYKSANLPEDFKRNLAKSLEAILLNKGYKVTGPYKSLNEMTYSDKKSVDFVLIPVVELYPEIQDNGCKNKTPLTVSSLTPAVQKGEIYCSGQVRFKGQLLFELREPLTQEKIYIKGIDFETEPENFEAKVVYEREQDMSQAIMLAQRTKLMAINNALNNALVSAYNKFIEMFKKYMPEGEEARQLEKQIKELKKLKRY
ncbi:hypothetical protein [Persephonella sp.]|uniref:hypothetical protein n=1 Tax=Persephonella sp. TaxID=2060922 RepID=UPI00261B86B8|nr:hypothetical protein [Persephonella sp.]